MTDSTADSVSLAAPKEEKQTLVDAFCRQLNEIVGKEFVEGHLRVTSDGLVVPHRCLPALRDAFVHWFARHTGGKQISSEKADKKLFGEVHKEVYLLEGKRVVAGILLPLQIESLSHYPAPPYRGRPLDATTYLHPDDPLFEGEGYQSHRTKQGVEFSVRSDTRSIRFPESVFSQWAATQAEKGNGLCHRDRFIEFSNELLTAKLLGKKVTRFVPGEYVGQKYEIARLGNCSAILLRRDKEDSYLVSAIVDDSERNLHSVVVNEYQKVLSGKLPKGCSKKRLGGRSGGEKGRHRGPKKPKTQPARKFSEGVRYGLQLTAAAGTCSIPAATLTGLVRGLRHHRPSGSVVKGRYSVRTLCELLGKEWQKAIRIEMSHLSSGVAARVAPTSRLWRTPSGWIIECRADASVSQIVHEKGSWGKRSESKGRNSGKRTTHQKNRKRKPVRQNRNRSPMT